MYLQQSKSIKNTVIESRSPCHFEIVTFKDFFSFINFLFVTRKRKNKSLTIELVT